MNDAIPVAVLSSLSSDLDNEELGVAFRLLAKLCETGKPLSMRNIHITAGLTKDRWQELSPGILHHFDTNESTLSHGILYDCPPSAQAPKVRSGTTPEIPLIVRPTRRARVPAYAAEDRPEPTSIRKAVYDNAVALLVSAGMSERTSRSVLAGLFKSYPEAEVVAAISDATRQEALVSPHAWIIANLKSRCAGKPATGSRHSPGKPAPVRQIVSPQLTGVSDLKAARIRDKNHGLKLHIPGVTA